MRKLTTEHIARVCHEANRAYCLSIGDWTQDPWESAADWQKESAIKGVETLIASPSMTPADLHNSWMTEKIQGGWVYGPVKDAEAKTHHCIVPYSELPEEQQMKDYLFHAIVKTLAKLPVGYVTT